jgi:diamine N-acetyltransferase
VSQRLIQAVHRGLRRGTARRGSEYVSLVEHEVKGQRAGVQIRLALEADADRVAALGARLFEQTFADDNSVEDMRLHLEETFSTERQAEELVDPDRMTWLADIDGVDVGFAMVRRGVGADGVSADRPAEVQRIYVDRAAHGSGIGHRLMGTCVDQAAQWGADVLWLGVWERNQRAISFYERAGFVTVGSHTFTLGTDPQRDIVMALTL